MAKKRDENCDGDRHALQPIPLQSTQTRDGLCRGSLALHPEN